MKTALRYSLTAIVMLLLACAIPSAAAAVGDIDPTEMSLDDNIITPQIPKKAVNDIRTHMEEIRQTLLKHSVNASLERNNEVVEVTIPVSELFAPNSTQLKDNAGKYLKPFVNLMRYPTMYKVLIAVHSDNTGEPGYTDELTSQRADAIDDYLCQVSGTKGTNLIPYGMGADDPLVENDSVANRAKNRRVEIYIVPEWQMIETAKSGRLK